MPNEDTEFAEFRFQHPQAVDTGLTEQFVQLIQVHFGLLSDDFACGAEQVGCVVQLSVSAVRQVDAAPHNVHVVFTSDLGESGEISIP